MYTDWATVAASRAATQASAVRSMKKVIASNASQVEI
jgi:hypothetical protein